VDEGRKRVLLIAASILAARKLAQYDGGKRVPATMSAIGDAIRWAEEIMKEMIHAGLRIGGHNEEERSLRWARSESARPAIEETARPSASRYGGILTDTQNYQLRLRLIRVGRCFSFIHGLCGDDAPGGRRF
jgi:hypothetical protein